MTYSRRTPVKTMIKRLFAPKKQPTVRVRTGQLYNDMATGQIIDAMTRIADPDETLKKLGYGRDFLRIMETDDEIYGALETRRDAVISLPWRLEDAQQAKTAPEPVQWLKEQLSANIGDLIRGAWNAVPYGYSVIEAVYRKEAGGRIGISHLTEKPFEWFLPQRDGSLLYQAPGGEQPVNTQVKFLLTRRNPTWRQPYGEALLSRLYWPWFFRYNNWRFWMQFVERFGEPLLVGATIDTSRMVSELQAMGYDAVIAVPEGTDVTAIQPKGDAHLPLEKVLTQRIQKTILGQTLTTSVDGNGSYAAAKVHNEVRLDKRNSDARLVAATMQRLINALWVLNGFAGEPPAFAFETEDNTVTPEQASAYASLKQAGVQLTEQYLLREHDFQAGDFTIESQGKTSPALSASRPIPGTLELAAGQGGQFTPAQQRIEALVDNAVQAAPSPIPAADIHQAIRLSKTPEELEQRLAKLAGNADLDAYRDILEKALFTADVVGYVAADKREL
jgi:phage gp29-like protein